MLDTPLTDEEAIITNILNFDLPIFARTLRASNRLPVTVRVRRAARAAGLQTTRWLSTGVSLPARRRDALGWLRAAGRVRTLGGNAIGGGIVLTTLLVFCFGVGSQIIVRENSPPASLPNSVLTVSGVTGGVAGLLLALVVFGVDLLAMRLKRIGFLVPYLVRRDGLLPSTAFVLAVVAANLLTGLIAALLEWPAVAVVMSILDLVLVPAVLLLTLRLLFNTVSSISSDTLSPALGEAHASHLAAEFRDASMQQAFLARLEAAGVDFGSHHGVFDTPGRAWHAVPIRGDGIVQDVRLDILDGLIEKLRANAGATQFKLNVGIGDEVRPSTALWFESEAGVGRLEGETGREVDQLSRRLVATRRTGDREFPSLVKRVVEKLVHIARHDDVDDFEQALNTVVELIRQRIRHPISGSAGGEHSPLSGLPGYLSDVQWFHIGEAVAQTGDPARVNALLAAAKEVLLEAAEHLRPATMRVFGQVIESVYAQIARTGNAAVAEDVGRQIDDGLEIVLVASGARPLAGWNEQITPDQVRQALPVYAAWVGWVLGLVRSALASNRPDDAANFADRLRRVRTEVEQRPEAGIVPEVDYVVDLLTLADVYLIGWCVREVDRDDPSAAAQATLALLVDTDDHESRLPTRELLLRAWERFPGADDGAGLLHATAWERDDAMRSGIAYTSSGPVWAERGLYAALLAAESEPRFHADRVMTPVPRSQPPDEESVQSHLTALVTRPEIRAALLTEDEGAPDAVSRLFAARRQAYRLDQLRRAVEAPVSETVIERLRAEAEAAASRNPSIVNAIVSLGVRETADGCTQVPTINQNGDYPKGLFVEETATSYIRFGEAIGTGLATQWQSRLVYEIEQRATATEAIRSEADLATMLESAVARIRAEGFEPNAVIVPRQERFIRTLVAAPDWRRRRRREWGPDHVGEWQGLSVFRCPYANTKAVVVFDTRALFGRASRAGARLMIIEHDVSRHADLLRAGEAAATEVAVPAVDVVRVRTRAALEGPLALCELRAAAKVPLDLERLGYVLPPDSPHYHRPGCGDAAGPGTSLSTSDAETGAPRSSCPNCHPDEWDDPSEQPDA